MISLHPAAELSQTRVVAGGRAVEANVTTKVPSLLITPQPFFRSFFECLAVLLRPGSGRWRRYPRIFPFAPVVRPGPALPKRGLAYSCILHLALCVLLVRLPLLLDILKRQAGICSAAVGNQRIYRVKEITFSRSLPPLQFGGSRGEPGRGTSAGAPPGGRISLVRPGPTIISSPLEPDNKRQTVIQASAPPELRIPHEVRVPDIVLQFSKPSPVGLLAPARVRQASEPTPKSSAPLPEPPPQLMNVARRNSLERISSLDLPVPPPAPAQETPPGATAAANRTPSGASSGAMELIAVGLDAVPLGKEIVLPNGNRYGAFSISGAAGATDSAGGPPGVPGGTGNGGSGTGGDHGSGTGSGKGGPGGGGSGVGGSGGGSGTGSGAGPGAGSGALNGIAVIGGTGSSAGTTTPSSPNAALIASMVYPVTSVPSSRTGKMVVMAGPSGGGGLHAYGVLRGGRIYTVYLPMPGKSWILQYSLPSRSKKQEQETGVRSTTLQIGSAVTAPEVERRFDFKREIPADKRNQTIVLHGLILDDGSVAELRILSGVDDVVDRAALAAFGRWKFKPALEAGKPVSVEILVGIPASAPAL